MLNWTTNDLVMHSRYSKQLTKTIWRLHFGFTRGTHIDIDEEVESACVGTYRGMSVAMQVRMAAEIVAP